MSESLSSLNCQICNHRQVLRRPSSSDNQVGREQRVVKSPEYYRASFWECRHLRICRLVLQIKSLRKTCLSEVQGTIYALAERASHLTLRDDKVGDAPDLPLPADSSGIAPSDQNVAVPCSTMFAYSSNSFRNVITPEAGRRD